MIEDIDIVVMIQLIGINLCEEVLVLNLCICWVWVCGVQIGLVGEVVDLIYDYVYVGIDCVVLESLLLKDILDEMKVKLMLVIVGQGVICEVDGEVVLVYVMKLVENLGSKLLILYIVVSCVGVMDVGVVIEGGLIVVIEGVEVIYNFGVDEVEIVFGVFVIYQGSYGDCGVYCVDLILLGVCYIEESGLFVNIEGWL